MTHGQWERWCREEAGFDPATAFKFIRVYNELGGANLATWQEIGWRALYEIATLPPEERTREHTLKSGVTKTVDEMTVRELREVKAALKAEREAREKAEARAQKAESDYEMVRISPRVYSGFYAELAILGAGSINGSVAS